MNVSQAAFAFEISQIMDRVFFSGSEHVDKVSRMVGNDGFLCAIRNRIDQKKRQNTETPS